MLGIDYMWFSTWLESYFNTWPFYLTTLRTSAGKMTVTLFFQNKFIHSLLCYRDVLCFPLFEFLHGRSPFLNGWLHHLPLFLRRLRWHPGLSVFLTYTFEGSQVEFFFMIDIFQVYKWPKVSPSQRSTGPPHQSAPQNYWAVWEKRDRAMDDTILRQWAQQKTSWDDTPNERLCEIPTIRLQRSSNFTHRYIEISKKSRLNKINSLFPDTP